MDRLFLTTKDTKNTKEREITFAGSAFAIFVPFVVKPHPSRLLK